SVECAVRRCVCPALSSRRHPGPARRSARQQRHLRLFRRSKPRQAVHHDVERRPQRARTHGATDRRGPLYCRDWPQGPSRAGIRKESVCMTDVRETGGSIILAAAERSAGRFVGRVWRPDRNGPALVVLRDGALVDITSKAAPTMRDLLEHDDPAGLIDGLTGETLGALDDIAANSVEDGRDPERPFLLAPIDLQAIKACGVTFARAMIERGMEERAAGDPARAEAIRARVAALIGDSLRNLKAGSPQAAEVKAALIEEGVWSQYLEVGIGPDAEVF